MTTKRLRMVVGENLRRIRGELSQEALAHQIGFFGLRWTRATVAAIETGRRDVSLVEALVLCEALGVGVSLEDLLDSHGATVVVGSMTAMGAHDWLALIRQRAKRQATSVSSLDSQLRLGKELGATPDVVNARAERLWGRSLAEERDRRLAVHPGEGSQAARAGWITRELLEELRTDFRKRKLRRTT